MTSPYPSPAYVQDLEQLVLKFARLIEAKDLDGLESLTLTGLRMISDGGTRQPTASHPIETLITDPRIDVDDLAASLEGDSFTGHVSIEPRFNSLVASLDPIDKDDPREISVNLELVNEAPTLYIRGFGADNLLRVTRTMHGIVCRAMEGSDLAGATLELKEVSAPSTAKFALPAVFEIDGRKSPTFDLVPGLYSLRPDEARRVIDEASSASPFSRAVDRKVLAVALSHAAFGSPGLEPLVQALETAPADSSARLTVEATAALQWIERRTITLDAEEDDTDTASEAPGLSM